ncbi:hypothetical protein Taro_031543 [Colocasia esculenta]|uniref:Retrotransposon gag domain-containing protein n=1 Tax=Colocasia esculenta TaxID=4460 RepID=A0A843VWY4_COLES|nr:hypothetical protein [Colocasia esculenta]
MEILEARVSPKLPLPTIAPYDGTIDPADHIHGFQSHMVFHRASDVAKCQAFPATLKETVQAWFESLPTGSISSFHQLKKSFRDNFLGGRSQPRTAVSLLSVRQKKGEALWDYVKRFWIEALRIPRLDVPLATSALIQGTRDGFLQRTLGVQQPSTLAELLSTAQRHAVCEESLAAGRAEQGEQSDKKRPSDNGSNRDRKKGWRNGDSPRRPRSFTDYTPLTVAPEQILAEIRDEPYVWWPPRMRFDPRRRNQEKYVRRNEDRQKRRERTPEQPINNEPNGQEINVIAGGFGAGGESNQSRRNYARQVHMVDRPPVPRLGPYPPDPSRARSEEAITFSDEDLVGVSTPHTDALVVSATINSCTVCWILVDNGSASDVLVYDYFLLMGLKNDQLTPVESPLFGFSGVSVQPMRRVHLPITLGTAPKRIAPAITAPAADQPSTNRGTPAEDLLPVRVDDDPEHVLYIGALLPKAEQQRYKAFLLDNLDVFAWSDDELPGIPPEVMVHRLRLDPRVPPVQQRRRPVNRER